MYDLPLVVEILSQILIASERIEKRFQIVSSVDWFLNSEEGIEKLDGICMQLIAIGESLKKLDQLTDKRLLKFYPLVDWKKAKGIRDVISHHYFDLNAEAIFDVCEENIPDLTKTIKLVLDDLRKTMGKGTGE